MYKTEVESKFAPNQEVWFMYKNNPRKDNIDHVKFYAFEKHILLEYVIKMLAGLNNLNLTEDKLFLTKEELIKSL